MWRGSSDSTENHGVGGSIPALGATLSGPNCGTREAERGRASLIEVIMILTHHSADALVGRDQDAAAPVAIVDTRKNKLASSRLITSKPTSSTMTSATLLYLRRRRRDGGSSASRLSASSSSSALTPRATARWVLPTPDGPCSSRVSRQAQPGASQLEAVRVGAGKVLGIEILREEPFPTCREGRDRRQCPAGRAGSGDSSGPERPGRR